MCYHFLFSKTTVTPWKFSPVCLIESSSKLQCHSHILPRIIAGGVNMRKRICGYTPQPDIFLKYFTAYEIPNRNNIFDRNRFRLFICFLVKLKSKYGRNSCWAAIISHSTFSPASPPRGRPMYATDNYDCLNLQF